MSASISAERQSSCATVGQEFVRYDRLKVHGRSPIRPQPKNSLFGREFIRRLQFGARINTGVIGESCVIEVEVFDPGAGKCCLIVALDGHVRSTTGAREGAEIASWTFETIGGDGRENSTLHDQLPARNRVRK